MPGGSANGISPCSSSAATETSTVRRASTAGMRAAAPASTARRVPRSASRTHSVASRSASDPPCPASAFDICECATHDSIFGSSPSTREYSWCADAAVHTVRHARGGRAADTCRCSSI